MGALILEEYSRGFDGFAHHGRDRAPDGLADKRKDQGADNLVVLNGCHKAPVLIHFPLGSMQ